MVMIVIPLAVRRREAPGAGPQVCVPIATPTRNPSPRMGTAPAWKLLLRRTQAINPD